MRSRMSSLAEQIASLSLEKRELLAVLLKEEQDINLAQALVLPRPSCGPAVLSFAQERLWFLDLLELGNPAYNLYVAFRLVGDLHLDMLWQTFDQVAARHEILRTTFVTKEGRAYQFITPSYSAAVDVVDLGGIPQAEREVEVRYWATEIAQKPFALSEAPPWRVVVFRLDPDVHILLLVMHHIISDGWSINVLMREVSILYSALVTGRSTSLSSLRIQYADYAHWQRQWLQGEKLDSQLQYWQRQLQDSSPLLRLPYIKSRPAIQTFRGARHHFAFPQSMSAAVRDLSRRENTSLFALLLTAFQVLLYRYSGQTGINVGFPIANRSRLETENLIGLFANTLVLRAGITSLATFRTVLHSTYQALAEAYAHQDVPFERLVDLGLHDRSLSYTPLFQAMFAMQNAVVQSMDMSGLSYSLFPVDNKHAMFDLTLSIMDESDGGLSGFLEYNTDLFHPQQMIQMVEHLQILLQAAVTDIEKPVGCLPLLSPTEHRRAVVDWNRTATKLPFGEGLYHMFEAQVERTPDAIAVSHPDGNHLSYRKLNERANQLAHYLSDRGIRPGNVVAVHGHGEAEEIVDILGILKAGGAYLPLTPACPPQRLAFMLEDARVSVLLAQSSTLETMPEQVAGLAVCLDAEWQVIARGSKKNSAPSAGGADLAYVIYTSGSTGKPKGVMATHAGAINLALAQIEAFGVQAHSRVLQFAPLSFDASVSEIFVTLLAGATLCLRDREAAFSAVDLVHQLYDESITEVTLPPSVLALLPDADLPALRTLVVAGEDCPADIAARWARGRRFINAYGPSEVTVGEWKDAAGDHHPSIGRPIANTQVYLLDDQLQLVPVGVPGEIHVGGVGLVRGYLHRPGLTAEKFVPNPFKASERLYRTGDLARYLPDGDIEFLGRIDHQRKLRGFRIELGEIEAVLCSYQAVQEAVVLLQGDDPISRYLAAFLIPHSESEVIVDKVRRFLRDQLPHYMIPSTFTILDTLPLTSNNKLDRRALADLEDARQAEVREVFVSPRTMMEEVIALTWQEVLQRDPIGIDDNFFDLGGNSLAMVRVHQHLRTSLNREFPIVRLFEYPTVRVLAEYLTQKDKQELFADFCEQAQERVRRGQAARLRRREYIQAKRRK